MEKSSSCESLGSLPAVARPPSVDSLSRYWDARGPAPRPRGMRRVPSLGLGSRFASLQGLQAGREEPGTHCRSVLRLSRLCLVLSLAEASPVHHFLVSHSFSNQFWGIPSPTSPPRPPFPLGLSTPLSKIILLCPSSILCLGFLDSCPRPSPSPHFFMSFMIFFTLLSPPPTLLNNVNKNAHCASRL